MFAKWRQHQAFKRIAKSNRPILVGPWRSELGFECLYWLPWLAQWRKTYGIAKDRIVAISRGGAGAWYDAGRTVDLYDYAPISSVRRAMLADSLTTGSVKQFALTRQEQTLLPMIAADLGIRRYHVLHPSVMYQQFAPWFDAKMPLGQVTQALDFSTPLLAPFPPLEMPLPQQYLAVSFYARHTWPMDDERKDWALALVDGLSKLLPVVVLESGLQTDEHVPFPMGSHVLSTAPYCTARNNLAVQSAVLAKAEAFIGTYGGTMQLAVRLKKPALGFYDHFSGTAYTHKVLTDWLGVQQSTPVMIGRPTDAKFVQEVMQVNYIPQASKHGSSAVKA